RRAFAESVMTLRQSRSGSRGRVSLAQGPIVGLAALPAPAKRLLCVKTGVTVLEQLAARLGRGSASVASEGRLESLPIHTFVSNEVPAGRGVSQGFGVAKADPPALSGGVHAFRPSRLHGRVGGIGDIVLNEGNDHRPSTPQGVLVDVQLVL